MYDLTSQFWNTSLSPPVDAHNLSSWPAGGELGLQVDLNEQGEHMGFSTETTHFSGDADSVYEGAPPETWPSLMDDFGPALWDAQWPDPWVDTEDPFGDAETDSMDCPQDVPIERQEQWDHLHATPNRAQYNPVPAEIPNEAAYDWGMEEWRTGVAYDPPVHDEPTHQWGADDVATNVDLQFDIPFSPAQPEPPEPESPEPEPEPLYNPYGDEAEPAYIRIDMPDKIIFQHASAGRIIREAGVEKTQWQRLREEHEEKYGDNIYGHWKTKREWDDANYFANAKTSQASLEDLLKTERYASDPPEFKTVRKLFRTIETKMNAFGPPKLTVEEVRLAEAPHDRHLLAYLDLEKAGDHLLGNPRFDGYMSFAPVVEFGPDGVRRFHNVQSADYWNLRQRVLQPGTTLGAVILMSDATQLSMFSGDVSAHGVYMSLANIDKSIREDLNQGAWLLVGIIPKSNWDKTLAALPGLTPDRRASLVNLLNRRLFHRCMEVITRPLRRTTPHEALDPAGNTCSVQYEFSIYGADLQEQCDAAAITRNICPHCEAKGKTLADCQCQAARSSQSIMARIRQVLAEFHFVHKRYPTPLEFWDAGKKYSLNGVQKPFWRKLPGFDIAMVLSPDLLHGFHKMFFDHIHKWNLAGLGAEEFDTRLKAQPDAPGERSFPQGVSQLKQLAGKDYRALERVHLAIVANAPDKNLPIHTEKSLAAFEEAYQTFQRNKAVWIENKSKRNKKGKVILGWAIPKLHIVGHAPDHIRWKGTLDNFSTETMEHLHGPMLKEPYRGSNKKGWVQQAIRWMARRNNMRGYRDFMVWLEATKRAEREGANGLDDPGLIRIDDDEDGDGMDEIEDADEEQGYWVEGDEGDEDEEEEMGGEQVEGDVGAVAEVEGEFEHELGGDSENENLSEVDGEEEGEGGWAEWREHEVLGGWGGDAQGLRSHDQGPTSGEHPEPQEPTASLEGPFMDEGLDHGGPQLAPENADDDDVGPLMTPFPLYRVAKKPNIASLTIGAVMERLGLPEFLDDLTEHPYFASLPITLDAQTQLDIWNILYVTIPKSLFCPNQKICRLFAQSGLDGKDRRWDAVFHVPTSTPGMRRPELETIHSYAVGRSALIFAVKPSPRIPIPRLMVYVQRFTPIPSTPGKTTGFYPITKKTRNGSPRYQVIAASQVARPCPLAPVFKDFTARGVVRNASLDHYNRFYINQYRTPNDFFFLHSF